MAAVAMFSPYGPARALARQVTATPTGNVYLLDARGGAMIDQADVAHFQTRGYSLAPVPVAGQVPVFAPYQPDQEMSRRVRHQPSGNHYIFNASGFAMVATADAAWFLTQGYSLASVPTGGQMVMYAPVEVSQALAGWIVNPVTGNSYVINGAGYVVVNPVDVAWFRSQGFAPALTAVEVFPPVTDGRQATIAADFVGGQYWAGAATQATFAAWLTAIGATFTRASSATYLDRGIIATAGTNGARFPTDLNGVPQGIRLTGAVTNILLQSNGFGTAPWVSSVIPPTPNAIISPDGTFNAFYIRSQAGTNTNQTTNLLAAATITGSPQTATIFAKQGDADQFGLGAFDQTAASFICAITVFWNAGAPPTVNINAGAGTVVVTQLAMGWYRFDLRFTGTANNQLRMFIYPERQVAPQCLGTGNYFYGAGFYNLPFGPDYVATTTATVTQAADNLNWPFTQTTFSALANTTGVAIQAGAPSRIVDQNTSAALFVQNFAPSQAGAYNGATVLGSGTVVPFYDTLRKQMSGGSPAGRSIVLDGGAVVSDSSPFMGSAPTTTWLGSRSGGSSFLYGNIAKMALWHGWYASGAEMVRLTGGAAPTWLQTLNGVYPSFYADITVGNYWYGAAQANFNAWLAALGATYARASSATYIDANGVVQTVGSGTPRVTSQGFRYTGAVTNIALQSNNFATTWLQAGTPVLTPNAITSPDGTNNGWLLKSTLGAATAVNQTIAGAVTLAPQTYTVFAKQGDATQFVYGVYDQTAGTSPIYVLTVVWGTGGAPPTVTVLASTSGTNLSNTVTPLANGWFRFDMTYTATTTAGNTLRPYIYAEQAAVTSTGKGNYFFGAQVQNLSFGGDYVPTTTVAATQAADSLFWPSPFVSSVGGSFVASGEAAATTAAAQVCLAFNNSSGIFGPGQGFLSRLTYPGFHEAGGNGSSATASNPPLNPYKICSSYNIPTTQQQVVTRDGISAVNATLDFTAVNAARVNVGALNSTLAQPYGGWFRSLAYYPTFPTPAQASALLASLP